MNQLIYNRSMRSLFRKHIFLPQDHGSWAFILSPLLVGAFAARAFSLNLLALIIAALSAYLLRQPAAVLVKVYSGRRPRTDLWAARFWFAAYSLILLGALTKIVIAGFGFMLWLTIPAIPIFAWHLWLVSQRKERQQAGVEILATGVLALSAPAALWAGLGRYEPSGWWLWILTWLQSSASIVYAYLRLKQREQAAGWSRSEYWKYGTRALSYTSFNLVFSFLAGLIGKIPLLIAVPFLVQWLETLWGIARPAAGWKPVRIGIRQLIVTTLWTILFIVFWK